MADTDVRDVIAQALVTDPFPFMWVGDWERAAAGRVLAALTAFGLPESAIHDVLSGRAVVVPAEDVRFAEMALDSIPRSRLAGEVAARFRAALSVTEETRTDEPTHTGGNAEKCPICRPLIDQPGGVTYPWICSGAASEETENTR